MQVSLNLSDSAVSAVLSENYDTLIGVIAKATIKHKSFF